MNHSVAESNKVKKKADSSSDVSPSPKVDKGMPFTSPTREKAKKKKKKKDKDVDREEDGSTPNKKSKMEDDGEVSVEENGGDKAVIPYTSTPHDTIEEDTKPSSSSASSSKPSPTVGPSDLFRLLSDTVVASVFDKLAYHHLLDEPVGMQQMVAYTVEMGVVGRPVAEAVFKDIFTKIHVPTFRDIKNQLLEHKLLGHNSTAMMDLSSLDIHTSTSSHGSMLPPPTSTASHGSMLPPPTSIVKTKKPKGAPAKLHNYGLFRTAVMRKGVSMLDVAQEWRRVPDHVKAKMKGEVTNILKEVEAGAKQEDLVARYELPEYTKLPPPPASAVPSSGDASKQPVPAVHGKKSPTKSPAAPPPPPPAKEVESSSSDSDSDSSDEEDDKPRGPSVFLGAAGHLISPRQYKSPSGTGGGGKQVAATGSVTKKKPDASSSSSSSDSDSDSD